MAAWVIRSAGGGYFTQRDAVIGVGDNQAEVRAGLEALVDLGLIEKTRNAGRPHYRVVASPVWPAIRQLADAVDSLVAGSAAPKLEADPPRSSLSAHDAVPIPQPRRGSVEGVG